MGTMDCLSWEVEERGRHLQMKGGRVGGSKDERELISAIATAIPVEVEEREGGRVRGSKDGGMKGGSAERRSFIIAYICSSHNNLIYCGHHLSHITHTWHIS